MDIFLLSPDIFPMLNSSTSIEPKVSIALSKIIISFQKLCSSINVEGEGPHFPKIQAGAFVKNVPMVEETYHLRS